MQGKVIIFSAPSGSGKTTLVKKLTQQVSNLAFSVSACSRKPRNNEKHGVDYYFLSAAVFKKRIANNEFIEWEEVYENSFYGTLKTELEKIWNNNKHVIFDVDVKGGLNLKKIFKEKSLAFFIKPPSMEELERRLRNRSSENEASIKKRMLKADEEMKLIDRFDKVIVNDKLETAAKEVIEHTKKFLES
jgi:guanylate kinase